MRAWVAAQAHAIIWWFGTRLGPRTEGRRQFAHQTRTQVPVNVTRTHHQDHHDFATDSSTTSIPQHTKPTTAPLPAYHPVCSTTDTPQHPTLRTPLSPVQPRLHHLATDTTTNSLQHIQHSRGRGHHNHHDQHHLPTTLHSSNSPDDHRDDVTEAEGVSRRTSLAVVPR